MRPALFFAEIMKYLHLQLILPHIFGKTIGGATSVTLVRDFDLPYNPTKFHKDPSKIKDTRVSTSFSHFGPYIT